MKVNDVVTWKLGGPQMIVIKQCEQRGHWMTPGWVKIPKWKCQWFDYLGQCHECEFWEEDLIVQEEE